MKRLLLLALLLPALAVAQGYPNRAVRVVVTFPPGGTPDIYGRVMAAELQKLWGVETSPVEIQETRRSRLQPRDDRHGRQPPRCGR